MKWLAASVLAVLFLGLIGYTHYLSVKPAAQTGERTTADASAAATSNAHGRLFTHSAECAECHQEIYDEWQRDQHASAWTEEKFSRFTANFTRIECLNCHAPEPMLQVGMMKE